MSRKNTDTNKTFTYKPTITEYWKSLIPLLLTLKAEIHTQESRTQELGESQRSCQTENRIWPPFSLYSNVDETKSKLKYE